MGLVLGCLLMGVVLLVWRKQRQRQQELDRNNVAQMLDEARRDADAVRKKAEAAELEAKGRVLQARSEFENEMRESRQNIQALERRFLGREEVLDKRLEGLEKRETGLSNREGAMERREQALEEKDAEAQRLVDEARRQVEFVAGISREEAKKILMEEMFEEARHDSARRVRIMEEEARAEADREAKKMIALAIARLAGDFVTERTVSVVSLPTDEMKGRIIGREGRNIRALEAATGIDLIVDDTPESVIISGHNPIRREIARLSLETLISDGRIHPGRIEEVVRRAEREMDDVIKEAGQKAVFDVGVHGIHPELIKLLGRLKFRYSYAQNVLLHSIEMAFICGSMAAELGLNEKQARRAALLHDIGKAVDHEVEGSHAIIGGELARKYGESPKIVNAIAAHHEEVRAETILAPLVDAADALSGARPGARREMLETYVRRLEELERISNSFKGVEKSYAVQAGRELRIIVQSTQVSDDESASMARAVAKKVENEMTYPGQIKVTVIRETRSVEYAH